MVHSEPKVSCGRPVSVLLYLGLRGILPPWSLLHCGTPSVLYESEIMGTPQCFPAGDESLRYILTD